MIFVTVGTQFFDELIDEVDRLAGLGVFGQPVLAQIGQNRRVPKHIDYFAFDPKMLDIAAKADLIISHGGTGCTCECLAMGKPFIAVVNDTKADNHQLEFLDCLSRLYDFCWIDSPKKLQAALPHARPATPLGASGLERLADDVRAFLQAPHVGAGV
ncbi:MAG: hypothetical protein JXQ75_10760 [Phycisphaerae bacterium]|nr:hypothetical protein [Phycisphaerae bacterium]